MFIYLIQEKGEDKLIVEFLNEKSCKINGGLHQNLDYTLDKIFNINSTQSEIFTDVAKSTIDDVLNGFNGTIFAYGQSGTGKTYTIYGTDLYNESKGIIPRSM